MNTNDELRISNRDKLESDYLDNSYWGKKILAAEKRGHFTESNSRESGSWVTCACGKASNAIEFNVNGEPRDAKLRQLGCAFDKAVDEDDFDEATLLLLEIEERASKLHERVVSHSTVN